MMPLTPYPTHVPLSGPLFSGLKKPSGRGLVMKIPTVADAVEQAKVDMGTVPDVASSTAPEDILVDLANTALAMMNNPDMQKRLLAFSRDQRTYNRRLLSELRKKDNLGPEQRLMVFLISQGVGPGKMAQMMADNHQLHPTIRQAMTELKSKGVSTRTLAEAQQDVDKIYGPGKYQVRSLAGVGTIAEAFSAEKQDGKTPESVIIKIVKKGITPDKLEQERQLALDFVESLYPDPQEQAYYRTRMDDLYTHWTKELDLASEAADAVALEKGATKYRVSQPLAIGYDTASGNPLAVSIVLSRAKGVSMEDLVDMIKHYRHDRHQYYHQFQKEIALHPWLAQPEVWMHSLPHVFLKAYTEQVLLRNQPVLTSHGDPHSGNVFITWNTKTQRLDPTFIDTGMVIKQKPQGTLLYAGFVLDTALGNSRGLAERMVKMAIRLPKGVSNESLVDRLAQDLDRKIFRARVNIMKNNYTGRMIDQILRDHRVILSPEQVGFFKANAQAVMTYRELSAAVGDAQDRFVKEALSDVIAGLKKRVWRHPLKVLNVIWPGLKHFLRHPKEALRVLIQFLSEG